LNSSSCPEKKDVVLVVASAGGHLSEALCALSLVESELHLVCNKNMLENARFKRIYTIRDSQYNALIHAVNLLRALWLFIRVRPDSMFSTGGPICLPFALVAKLTGTRFVYLDTMARVTSLSNTGRIIEKYSLCDVFLCQWQAIAEQHESVEYCGTVFRMAD
jgi:UDP-N-acetylglucosamine:LPS N-acetylglucosamine transferase